MHVTPEKAAESFGITVEKLEKIRKRKDCPKDIVDSEGFYDTEVVEKMLAKLREQSEQAAKKYLAKKQSTESATKKIRCKKTSKRVTAKRSVAKQTGARVVAESLDEYIARFWETDQRWLDFVTQDLNETWMRHFIGEALRFGHETAYPIPTPACRILGDGSRSRF